MNGQRLGPAGRMQASIQLHVSRRCNIRCLHCYSSSGPEQRETLSPDMLQQAVREAADEGYAHLAISGGEPLMYAPLSKLLASARECGMLNTITTNGMLLDKRRLANLDGIVDLIAISLDGIPESHNRMRNSRRAFGTMQGHLAGLRDSGIPFGFIFTLTQFNLHELDWVTDFALEQGARLLQIHPLEEFGRASEQLSGDSPDPREKSMAFLEFLRVQAKAKERLHVQLDLADSVALRHRPEQVYADSLDADVTSEPLAHLVAPLVVETDGTVVPLQYGFPRQYALGNLNDYPLRALAETWRKNGHGQFRALCRQTFEKVIGGVGLPFVNWYELVASEGRSLSVV
jgi:MoaA/NifB/PqqE/SkfB family radical SAM enzyme